MYRSYWILLLLITQKYHWIVCHLLGGEGWVLILFRQVLNVKLSAWFLLLWKYPLLVILWLHQRWLCYLSLIWLRLPQTMLEIMLGIPHGLLQVILDGAFGLQLRAHEFLVIKDVILLIQVDDSLSVQLLLILTIWLCHRLSQIALVVCTRLSLMSFERYLLLSLILATVPAIVFRVVFLLFLILDAVVLRVINW